MIHRLLRSPGDFASCATCRSGLAATRRHRLPSHSAGCKSRLIWSRPASIVRKARSPARLLTGLGSQHSGTPYHHPQPSWLSTTWSPSPSIWSTFKGRSSAFTALTRWSARYRKCIRTTLLRFRRRSRRQQYQGWALRRASPNAHNFSIRLVGVRIARNMASSGYHRLCAWRWKCRGSVVKADMAEGVQHCALLSANLEQFLRRSAT